jgi:hypothetical protein
LGFVNEQGENSHKHGRIEDHMKTAHRPTLTPISSTRKKERKSFAFGLMFRAHFSRPKTNT